MEVQSSLNDFGVVEHHQCAGRQVIRQIDEVVFADCAVCASREQLRLVAFGERIFGNALIGECIVEVFDFELAGIGHGAPTYFVVWSSSIFSTLPVVGDNQTFVLNFLLNRVPPRCSVLPN